MGSLGWSLSGMAFLCALIVWAVASSRIEASAERSKDEARLGSQTALLEFEESVKSRIDALEARYGLNRIDADSVETRMLSIESRIRRVENYINDPTAPEEPTCQSLTQSPNTEPTQQEAATPRPPSKQR